MLFRFCLYGFLKNQRYFEPFLMLVFLQQGFSFFLIGLLYACRDLTVNLLEVPSGAIADSFGRRGSMMFSFAAYIASFAVLGFAPSAGVVWLVFVGMFLYGIGDTFRTGTHKAMIFEWLRLNGRSEERTKVYGITRSWSQIGSAVSGLIAAAFVLASGNFHYVFYFAIIPYLLNLINFAGYPKQLDGEHEKARTIGQSVERLKASLGKAIGERRLRRLMVESMGWEGFFGATKDYLQPLLQSLAVASLAFWMAGQGTEPVLSAETATPGWLNDSRKTALLIGPVYAVLFLMSAWGSRMSHRVGDWCGGVELATRPLWFVTIVIFAVITIGAWLEIAWVLVGAFVVLHVFKNIWRPILISRFDTLSEAHEGATILSLESQSQRAATMVLAPLMGLIIDHASAPSTISRFWPIGVVGGAIAITMYLSTDRHADGGVSSTEEA
ncbi:MAG: MFS transporter [Mariniblastus sp.]